LEVRLIGDAGNYAATLRKAASDTQRFGDRVNATSKSTATAGTHAQRAATSFGRYGTAASMAAGHTNAAGKATSYLGSVLQTATGTMIGFVAASALISGVGRAFSAVSDAVIDFDRNMRNVQSITLQSDRSLSRMGDTILGLSNRLPQSASELSAGLYDIASSGFKGAAGVRVLETAAVAASAGLSSTATSAKGIVAVLNAYGLGADKAKQVSDELFQTVNVGIVTFDELASQVGDFVGTAAALGVPFKDLGSAFAAITLGGVNSAEAATSLNRVLITMISPGEELAATFRSWGFESGSAAVQALGLRGVMERIRTETGGTAAAMQALFPEMRAARGAFMLVAAEGRNYARAAGEMAKASLGLGASQRALNEQSKGLGFQLEIMKNNIVNAGVALGSDMAPGLAKGIAGMRDLGREAMSVGREFGEAIAPGVDAAGRALADLGDIAEAAWEALSPILEFGGAVGLQAAAVTFNAIAASVEELTGFLSDHDEIVKAVAIAYSAHLVIGLTRAAAGFAALQRVRVGIWLLGIQSGFAGLTARLAMFNSLLAGGVPIASAWRGAMAGMLTGTAVLTAGLAVAIGMLVAYKAARDKAFAEGDAAAKEITAGFNLDTLKSYERAIAANQRAGDTARKAGKEYEGLGGALRTAAEALSPFNENKGEENLGVIRGSRKEVERLSGEYLRLGRNISKVIDSAGLVGKRPLLMGSTPEALAAATTAVRKWEQTSSRAARNVAIFADVMGVDLRQGGEKGERAVRRVTRALMETGKGAGFSAEQVARMSASQIASLGDAEEAATKYRQGVFDAFSKTGDIIGKLGADPSKLSRGAIEAFYNDTIAQNDKFLANIQAAYRTKIPTSLIAKMLVAGPEAAGPLLQTILDNYDDAFGDFLTKQEARLAKMASFAAQIASLQQIALTGGPATAALLPDAIAILQEFQAEIDAGAPATIQSIAESLKMPESVVATIAATYSIPVPDVKVRVLVDQVTMGMTQEELRAFVTGIDALPTEILVEPRIDDPEALSTWADKARVALVEVEGIDPTIVAGLKDDQDLLAFFRALRERQDAIRLYLGLSVDVNDMATPKLQLVQTMMDRLRASPNAFLNVTTTRFERVITGGGSPFGGSGNRKNPAIGGIIEFADGGIHQARPANVRNASTTARPRNLAQRIASRVRSFAQGGIVGQPARGAVRRPVSGGAGGWTPEVPSLPGPAVRTFRDGGTTEHHVAGARWISRGGRVLSFSQGGITESHTTGATRRAVARGGLSDSRSTGPTIRAFARGGLHESHERGSVSRRSATGGLTEGRHEGARRLLSFARGGLIERHTTSPTIRAFATGGIVETHRAAPILRRTTNMRDTEEHRTGGVARSFAAGGLTEHHIGADRSVVTSGGRVLAFAHGGLTESRTTGPRVRAFADGGVSESLFTGTRSVRSDGATESTSTGPTVRTYELGGLHESHRADRSTQQSETLGRRVLAFADGGLTESRVGGAVVRSITDARTEAHTGTTVHALSHGGFVESRVIGGRTLTFARGGVVESHTGAPVTRTFSTGGVSGHHQRGPVVRSFADGGVLTHAESNATRSRSTSEHLTEAHARSRVRSFSDGAVTTSTQNTAHVAEQTERFTTLVRAFAHGGITVSPATAGALAGADPTVQRAVTSHFTNHEARTTTNEVRTFAKGGMSDDPHTATIAKAGDWRVWAEPETGGEAYIPLAAAKRKRSTAILEEVAQRFGLQLVSQSATPFAQGGTTTTSTSTSSSSRSTSVVERLVRQVTDRISRAARTWSETGQRVVDVLQRTQTVRSTQETTNRTSTDTQVARLLASQGRSTTSTAQTSTSTRSASQRSTTAERRQIVSTTSLRESRERRVVGRVATERLIQESSAVRRVADERTRVETLAFRRMGTLAGREATSTRAAPKPGEAVPDFERAARARARTEDTAAEVRLRHDRSLIDEFTRSWSETMVQPNRGTPKPPAPEREITEVLRSLSREQSESAVVLRRVAQTASTVHRSAETTLTRATHQTLPAQQPAPAPTRSGHPNLAPASGGGGTVVNAPVTIQWNGPVYGDEALKATAQSIAQRVVSDSAEDQAQRIRQRSN
jgi:TP901 family phage tail tape measure protein